MASITVSRALQTCLTNVLFSILCYQRFIEMEENVICLRNTFILFCVSCTGKQIFLHLFCFAFLKNIIFSFIYKYINCRPSIYRQSFHSSFFVFLYPFLYVFQLLLHFFSVFSSAAIFSLLRLAPVATIQAAASKLNNRKIYFFSFL